MLSIGEVAKQSGLAASAIRFYEREGLISTPERASGRRAYTESVFDELTVIGMAQEAGFSISEIRHLVSGFAPETAASERWRSMAASKVSDVELRIARLERMKTVLLESLECNCLTLATCASVCWSGAKETVAIVPDNEFRSERSECTAEMPIDRE